jgi:signal transduction histidine kinase
MSLRKRFKTAFEKNPGIWGFIIGACLGFLLLRPYTILIYTLFDFIETGNIGLHGQISIEGPKTFRFFMLLTSISFLFFGGVIGLFFGKWYERKQRHIEEQVEREKKEAAIEILRELNVTLSHYIINSSSIIRGFAQRGNRKTDNEKIKEYFSIIQEEVDKTIAVMKGLEAIKEIESIKYVQSGTTMMIDLKKQIKEQLEKLENIRKEERTL